VSERTSLRRVLAIKGCVPAWLYGAKVLGWAWTCWLLAGASAWSPPALQPHGDREAPPSLFIAIGRISWLYLLVS